MSQVIKAVFSAGVLQVQSAGLQAGGVLLSGQLDFELRAGVVNVLRGENGAGKSTLLKGISNALPIHSVLFKPEFGLRDELLVDQHVQILLAHLGQATGQVDSLLKQVGLAEWQYERIGALSSGQRARLGLCCLLAGHFRLWLLDEPLNALDIQGLKVFATVLEKHLQSGGLLLMATHVDASLVTVHLKGASVIQLTLQDGRLSAEALGSCPGKTFGFTVEENHLESVQPVSGLHMLQRELSLFMSSPQALLWGALFHWLVLSFFGIGLGKASAGFAQVAMWTSLLLAVVLAAKDWFVEDHRVGWIAFLNTLHFDNIPRFWLVRMLWAAASQAVVLVPVTGLAALQFGLETQQVFALMTALCAGVLAAVPLLGLLALLVMLTRGGAVLVYLLALPLLVPVLIFGLEASQAAQLGRSAGAPLAVLVLLGLLMLMTGPFAAKRLVALIQE
jgi:heme exporter protein CcmB